MSDSGELKPNVSSTFNGSLNSISSMAGKAV
jgi:hypothetical protein